MRVSENAAIEDEVDVAALAVGAFTTTGVAAPDARFPSDKTNGRDRSPVNDNRLFSQIYDPSDSL